jgi:hypothetical protein
VDSIFHAALRSSPQPLKHCHRERISQRSSPRLTNLWHGHGDPSSHCFSVSGSFGYSVSTLGCPYVLQVPLIFFVSSPCALRSDITRNMRMTVVQANRRISGRNIGTRFKWKRYFQPPGPVISISQVFSLMTMHGHVSIVESAQMLGFTPSKDTGCPDVSHVGSSTLTWL